MAEVKVKGSVLKARLGLIDELAPEDGRERVLRTLSDDDRKRLDGLMATGWYAFGLGKRLDDAIVHALGGGRSEFFERIGEASAEQNLGTVHRDFLARNDPHGFLERAPLIYSFYYDRGRRDYERVGEREAVLTTRDAETFSAADCLTVVGWYRKALEMCGCSEVHVVEEECRARGNSVCRYRLTWG
jgi:uncharacterized protein (TIGR02265 family)